MKLIYQLPLGLALAWGLAGCGTQTKTETTTGQAPGTTADANGRENLAAVPGVQPVALPNPGIPGFTFPQDSSTINRWIATGAATPISLHGWGIWTALSSTTNERYNGDTLRVFETWATKAEVDSALQHPQANKSMALLARRPRRLQRRLSRPRQFFRDPQLTHRLRALGASAHAMVGASSEEAVFESVSYDPAAARTIVSGQLFLASKLQGMLNNGQTGIPEFPNNSLAIKPVYEVVPGPNRSKGLYQMKVWTGSPAKPQTYGQDKWPACVYVDIANHGAGAGQVSQGCGPASPATTYNLADFVHYTLTAQEAAAMGGGQAGDYAVLVAMHITTKEIKRWTWQTMWWAPNPTQAPAPSSPAVAAVRPAQLVGAPRHYAMAISYQMITPVQPFAGGNNKGTSIYAFNPYLEAGFSNSTFSEVAQVVTNGITVINDFGVRTNCMSCHAQATFTPIGSKTIQSPGYIADTYVDMAAPKFKGNLKTDFLWSIADMSTSTADSAR